VPSSIHTLFECVQRNLENLIDVIGIIQRKFIPMSEEISPESGVVVTFQNNLHVYTLRYGCRFFPAARRSRLTAADRTLQQHDGKLLVPASLLSGVPAKITERVCIWLLAKRGCGVIIAQLPTSA